jgi:uncharacterized membrane protein YphA (DoxX/SURF4 family)
MARGFYILSLALSVTTLVVELSVISGTVTTQGVYGGVFHALQYRAWIVIGAAISTSLSLLRGVYDNPSTGANRATIRAFTSSPLVLKGLCLSVSFSFLDTEIGKLANDAIMREFFQQSGYALWFMYSIMALETLGALALFVSRTIIPAVSGLAILMLGAIFTHARNGDPFSDSLEALHLLIILGCILLISLLRSRSRPEESAS